MQEQRRMPREGFFHSLDEMFKIDRNRVDKPWSMRKYHYHDAVELYYLVSGSRYYFVKDKTYRVRAGELVTICPYDIHATAATEQGAYERVLITFKKEYLAQLPDAFGADILSPISEKSRVVVLTRGEQRWLEATLDALAEADSSTDACSEAFVKSALVGILILLGKKSERADDEILKMPAGAMLVSRVSGYISANFAEKISLRTVAAEFFVSPSYLSRTFSRITGMTITEHINAVRIKEAERLLLTSDATVSAIAERVGFSSQTHFERVFKSVTHTRPLDFRTKRGEG